MQESLKSFYSEFKNGVKSYKGYILMAVDGSDFEIPNTMASRKEYNGKQQAQCARVTVSTCFDVLNKYTLDVLVENYDNSETEMLKQHLKTIEEKKILSDYPSIVIFIIYGLITKHEKKA